MTPQPGPKKPRTGRDPAAHLPSGRPWLARSVKLVSNCSAALTGRSRRRAPTSGATVGLFDAQHRRRLRLGQLVVVRGANAPDALLRHEPRLDAEIFALAVSISAVARRPRC